MVKTIKSAIVERRIQELHQMFSDGEYSGTVDVVRNPDSEKIMVTIRTKDILVETQKENNYLHGALMEADNYSFHAESDMLVVRLGFFVGHIAE